MASLEDLARKKFTAPPLSSAEELVARNVPGGTVADCRDLGGGVDPAKANGSPQKPDERWPDTRSIRADLIRWLCVDSEARQQVDPKGVQIRGARITGSIDLSFATVQFPLGMFGCRVDQPINVLRAKIAALNLESSWTGTITADGLELLGSLILTKGFHAEGEVRLLGGTIGGILNARGGAFKNPNGDAFNADRIKVIGSVFLDDGFIAEGEVALRNATIGALIATGGTFNNSKRAALAADGIKVAGSVFLKGGFSCDGEVRLPGATIEGNLEADGGRLKNSDTVALFADGIRVAGNIYLRNGFCAVGDVRLVGAEIGGQLEVDDAWLDSLDLVAAHIAGSFFWRNIHKDSNPRFPRKKWMRFLDLTNAKVGTLVDQEASWPETGRLRLDGFVYDSIGNGPTDADTRLRWLGLQPERDGYLPQPYEQLVAVLRRMGHEHQVVKVAIAKKWDLRKRGHLGFSGWIRNWFLYFAVGYGYRAWLAFVWLFLLVVLGSQVFSRAQAVNVLVPSDLKVFTDYENSNKQELTPAYPRFHALLYSLDVVSPFDLGQKSHWGLVESIGYWQYEFYSLFQLFVGWALLIVAAAVPAGFINKD